MHVWDCTFENTDNGIRLKAERGEGGLVENLTYDNIRMTNVRSPIVITSYYHGLPSVGQTDPAKLVNGRTPIWRNISITNVHATGSRDAGLLMGLPEMPIDGLTLRHVSIAATQPMRLGNACGLAWEDVVVSVPSGKPLIVEDGVQGTGLPTK